MDIDVFGADENSAYIITWENKPLAACIVEREIALASFLDFRKTNKYGAHKVHETT